MPKSAANLLDWLQEFYLSECDGESEDGTGFTISTSDDPGWSVDFDLEGTSLQDKDFKSIRLERTGDDWVRCRVDTNMFQGRGGPKNLTELLTIFRDWADASAS
jgi:hypothetical protein